MNAELAIAKSYSEMSRQGVSLTAATAGEQAPKRLIGIMGLARVGKDTATAHLCDTYGMESYAFADPIKSMLTGVFGDLFRDGDREAPIDWLGKSPRQLMQTLGTEWGREIVHPDLWVLVADQMWKKYQEIGWGAGVVLSDVRFRNEAEWILAQGGLLISLSRDGVAAVATHVSEQNIPFDLANVSLENNGTVEELAAAVTATVDARYGG